MAFKTAAEENMEGIEVFDQCYLCKEWWWQRVMESRGVPDQAGFVTKYVCPECLRAVDNRSCQELVDQK